jgi:hypothetical protein
MTKKITLFEDLAEIMKPEIAGIDFNKPQPKINRALIYDINSTEFDKECPAHDFDIEHNGFTYIIEIYKFSASITDSHTLLKSINFRLDTMQQ